MKKPALFLLIILAYFSFSLTFASSFREFKLAVFDNPQQDPSRKETSQELANAYLSGIKTAIAVADVKGIHIKEKEFFHTNSLPNIIKQASNVKAWEPDIIMGFSTSNDFLMSKAFFGDQLVLSVSATNSELATLPTSFYSLGSPDTDAVNIIIKFINEHYKNANLFITVAAESKESVDFADLLSKAYKKQHPTRRALESEFLTDDLDHLNIHKYMKGYQQGDVIIVMSIGYNSAIDLMNKIASYLSPTRTVFVTSTDNWGNDSISPKISGTYDAFRIDTLSGAQDTKEYRVFVENYKKFNHKMPTDKISFVTYQTIMSFVTAVEKYPPSHEFAAKKAALWSYQKALKQNANWFRPPRYIVYKMEPQKEVQFEILTQS